MPSDLAMLAGAAIFLGGMIAGRTWPARRRKPKPVQPARRVRRQRHRIPILPLRKTAFPAPVGL